MQMLINHQYNDFLLLEQTAVPNSPRCRHMSVQSFAHKNEVYSCLVAVFNELHVLDMRK